MSEYLRKVTVVDAIDDETETYDYFQERFGLVSMEANLDQDIEVDDFGQDTTELHTGPEQDSDWMP